MGLWLAQSTFNALEKQLLDLIGHGHPDRRVHVFHRGESFVVAPFTWAELCSLTKTPDDVMANAIAKLVSTGVVDSARQPTRLFRWIKRSKPATVFFVTRYGKGVLSSAITSNVE
jgi:hypothetical protein